MPPSTLPTNLYRYKKKRKKLEFLLFFFQTIDNIVYLWALMIVSQPVASNHGDIKAMASVTNGRKAGDVTSIDPLLTADIACNALVASVMLYFTTGIFHPIRSILRTDARVV